MNQPAIQVKNLLKKYGDVVAVNNLDFEVSKAECYGLLGPNGAGKTTSMKIIYGKAQPSPNPNTIIDIFGYNPQKDALTIKAFSGIVPQQDNLDSGLNVTDNLLIYARFYGLNIREAQKRIAELLDFMELQDKARSKINELSGGMQRRLTIARALLNRPQLLMLDEPTTGLDPQVRHLIWSKIRELKEMGVTVLLTTHYMEEAFQICDRIMIMDKGLKILEGQPHQLMRANLEAYVMEIYAANSENLILTSNMEDIRHEEYQDSWFFYSNDQAQLSNLAESIHISDYHIRQANLEDLFLKVTGRGLNELQ